MISRLFQAKRIWRVLRILGRLGDEAGKGRSRLGWTRTRRHLRSSNPPGDRRGVRQRVKRRRTSLKTHPRPRPSSSSRSCSTPTSSPTPRPHPLQPHPPLQASKPPTTIGRSLRTSDTTQPQYHQHQQVRFLGQIVKNSDFLVQPHGK